MEARMIADGFAVAGQIGIEHVQAIANYGFKSLICNRPDHEEGAVAHDAIEAAALQAGMQFHFLPVVSGAITAENAAEMARIIRSAPKPILAYCRTGGRCTNLFALAQAAG